MAIDMTSWNVGFTTWCEYGVAGEVVCYLSYKFVKNPEINSIHRNTDCDVPDSLWSSSWIVPDKCFCR
jgi:hypothetical protein